MELSWTTASWVENATNWIHLALAPNRVQVNGRITQPHVRPWSTVLKIPTNKGFFYFKATSPSLAHEPALTQALARMQPELMPEILAIEEGRGWMLMADMQATLRSLIHSTADLQRWEVVLRLLAQVQQETAGHISQLLIDGALDRRLTVLPEYYAKLLDNVAAMMINQTDGLIVDEYRQLRMMTSDVAQLCTQLEGFNIPETIHHEDFHDANVFVRDGRYILSDWGESGIGHPFCTLLVTLRSIAYRLKLENDAPEILHLRDIYLDCWRDYETEKNLHTAFDLAYRIGMICRALTWHRVISPLPPEQKVEYAAAVPGWLQEFLNHS